ncbi:hypothetical protein [Solemya velesiana gill symbiont]|uniref:hypothetical protein n=1 Tax=Solemya velesiana gill symbiont TaxID=1918948 RepID=UPI00108368B0|nr:hypothetical protein [Solemya velesiana gill symbiont]
MNKEFNFKRKGVGRILCSAFFLTSAAWFSTSAYADGTEAGTTVSNSATLNFSIGGVDQDDIVSSPTGNDDPSLVAGDTGAETTDFLVDRKLDLLVTADNTDHVNVVPGLEDAALAFTVTNQSNTPVDGLDILLMAVHSSNPTGFTTGSDNFDVDNTTIQYFLDANNDNKWDSGDTALTTTNGVATLNNVDPDESFNILVVADIDTIANLVDNNTGIASANNVNGSISALTLVAQVAESDGTVISNDDSGNVSPGGTANDIADDPESQEDVFADNAALAATTLVTGNVADTIADEDLTFDFVAGTLHTSGAKDVASNGQASDTSAFKLASATVSLQKTVTTFCDDINGTTNPKSIPGAYQRYALTVTNAASASASATLTSLQDVLQATDITLDGDFIDGTGVPACADSSPTDATGNGFRVTCTDTAPDDSGVDKATPRACVEAAAFFSSNADSDGADHDGSVNSGTINLDYSQLLPASDVDHDAGELAPGESVTVEFQVRIN